MPIRLVVGLGNPGERYRRTRHNAGFLVLERLQGSRRVRWRPGCGGHWAEILLDRCPLVLFKPASYMNLSGGPVARMADRGFSPGEILVVCDDLDLPLGRVRIRPGGGSGGHRGLASIASSLGTRAFPRLRVGIGRPADGEVSSEYVLRPFAPEERELVDRSLDLAAQAVTCAVASGVDAAMNAFNGAHALPGDPEEG